MGLSLFCCFIASTGDHPNGLVYLDPIPYTSVNKITFVLKKETALNLSPLFSYVGWDNTLRFEQIGRHLSSDIFISVSLHWRHNDQDGVSNHQPVGCLLNRLFRRGWKKTPKLRVTGLCGGNSPGLVNSPHKGSVTRKMFPFDDVTMSWNIIYTNNHTISCH